MSHYIDFHVLLWYLHRKHLKFWQRSSWKISNHHRIKDEVSFLIQILFSNEKINLTTFRLLRLAQTFFQFFSPGHELCNLLSIPGFLPLFLLHFSSRSGEQHNALSASARCCCQVAVLQLSLPRISSCLLISLSLSLSLSLSSIIPSAKIRRRASKIFCSSSCNLRRSINHSPPCLRTKTHLGMCGNQFRQMWRLV